MWVTRNRRATSGVQPRYPQSCEQAARSSEPQRTRPGTEVESQSLAGFRDAICVPLGVSAILALPNAAQPKNTLTPLGALHVYKTSRPFTEREVQFCELLANALANNLRVLRERRVLEADIQRLRERAAACGQGIPSH